VENVLRERMWGVIYSQIAAPRLPHPHSLSTSGEGGLEDKVEDKIGDKVRDKVGDKVGDKVED
jgi:hypothetical protein